MSQPVTDFSTDFDHTDERWVADPYPIWDELRQGCPVAHTDRYGARGCRPVTPTWPRSPRTPSTSRRAAS